MAKPVAKSDESVVAIERGDAVEFLVIKGRPSQTLTVEGEERGFHHTSELEDGTWVYSRLR